MKLHAWMEIFPFDRPPLKQFFLGRKAIVYVLMNYGKVEKHAYMINDNNELQVFTKQKHSEESMYNPKIKGNAIMSENNHLTFTWKFGSDTAYSLFDQGRYEEGMNKDQKVEQALNTGIVIGMNRARGTKTSLWQDPVLLALGVVVIVSVATLAMVYLGFDAHGVPILGGQT
ncbi:hypothetical protein LCGC14_3087640 [marine sediment metagenome]|uniref:Uncharacterized protein n=1 Tax=marine sediment metagenome TaxID=412755 RepID=A0A0F8YIZ3_9ZZZZ